MKIIYTTEIGISIVHPTGELSIEQVFQKDVPEQYKHTAQIVEDEYIPSDRTFRDAWEFTGVDLVNKTCISENLDKAKEIQKNRLRIERKPLLESLDAEYMKALETKSDDAEITKEKQRLRDITKLVDECKDTKELRTITCMTGKT